MGQTLRQLKEYVVLVPRCPWPGLGQSWPEARDPRRKGCGLASWKDLDIQKSFLNFCVRGHRSTVPV